MHKQAGKQMKHLIGNVMTYFSSGSEWLRPSKANDLVDVIVPGYITEDDDDLRESSYLSDLNRRQVGIFYADIDNYAQLTAQDEEAAQLRLTRAIKIMMSQVAANSGRIVHLAGDAILAEFKDADSALHCAINVQLAARQWNADLNSNEQVLFRIGVSFGELVDDKADIFANAANLTARLEKLASSGGICVSELVRQKLDDHPSIRFVSMGKQYLKNISEPVQALWIEVDPKQVVDNGLTSAVKVTAVAS